MYPLISCALACPSKRSIRYSAITGCAATYAAHANRCGTLEIPWGSPVGFVARPGRPVFLYTFPLSTLPAAVCGCS
jgi:hypothetical protein